jgi:3-hydroxybutyryl-CoA dehydrogenase
MIKLVGVAGCGVMGSGITQVCSQSGYQTIVFEIDQVALENGLDSIKNALNRGVEKGKLSLNDKNAILSRIQITTRIMDFKACDIVIEAISENLELKKRLFADLDRICSSSAILATNTSCLPVIEIAMAASRPGRIIGLHFFNPAPLTALLELVTTVKSEPDVVKSVEAFGKSLGKTIVFAKDTPGFIVNRLAIPFILNAIYMLENGVASSEDIDKAVKLGLNHPLGPLALADLIGLDVIYAIAQSMYEEFKDAQYAPPVLLKRMVAAGRLGRKTGEGFYKAGIS